MSLIGLDSRYHRVGFLISVLINSFLWGEVGAAETVRLSVGRETSRADIDRVVKALRKACDRAD